MNGKTPFEKLSSFRVLFHSFHVLTFPVILLEELLRAAGLFTKMFSDFLKSGTYVPTKCPFLFLYHNFICLTRKKI